MLWSCYGVFLPLPCKCVAQKRKIINSKYGVIIIRIIGLILCIILAIILSIIIILSSKNNKQNIMHNRHHIWQSRHNRHNNNYNQHGNKHNIKHNMYNYYDRTLRKLNNYGILMVILF